MPIFLTREISFIPIIHYDYEFGAQVLFKTQKSNNQTYQNLKLNLYFNSNKSIHGPDAHKLTILH